MKQGIGALIAILWLAGTVFLPAADAQVGFYENPLVGKKAPDFTLSTVDGEEVNMTEFRGGQKAIIFFWATWCPHCRRALNVLNEKQEEFRKKGIKLIPVDNGESPGEVRAYLEKTGIDMKMLVDEEDSLVELYNVFGIPMFIFIDQSGEIRSIKHSLPADYEKLLDKSS